MPTRARRAIDREDFDNQIKTIQELKSDGDANAELITSYLTSSRPGIRMAALAALRDLSGGDTAELALAYLLDQNSSVRSTSAEILGYLMHRQAAIPLAYSLLSDTDTMVRVFSAESLGYLAVTSQTVLESLIDAMENDRSPLVRAYAAESIGRLHAMEARERVAEKLKFESSTRARISMLECLSRLGDQKSFLSLVKTLRRTRSHDIRDAIMNLLGGLLSDPDYEQYRQLYENSKAKWGIDNI